MGWSSQSGTIKKSNLVDPCHFVCFQDSFHSFRRSWMNLVAILSTLVQVHHSNRYPGLWLRHASGDTNRHGKISWQRIGVSENGGCLIYFLEIVEILGWWTSGWNNGLPQVPKFLCLYTNPRCCRINDLKWSAAERFRDWEPSQFRQDRINSLWLSPRMERGTENHWMSWGIQWTTVQCAWLTLFLLQYATYFHGPLLSMVIQIWTCTLMNYGTYISYITFV